MNAPKKSNIMNKLTPSSRLAGTLLITAILCSGSAFAQKQPDVQDGNLKANTVKIDGDAKDWQSPLKAFNKSTGLAYSVANDDKKLYVVMQASDINTTRKIMMGGITFSINADGKKRTKEVLSLTYPAITQTSRRAAMGGGGQRNFGSFQQMTQEQRDSMQHAMMQKQLDLAKDIKVFGFKGVADSSVSVYNEYSIKAVAKLSKDGVYTYELCIPLELIPDGISDSFGYNIKVNGLEMRNFGGGGNFGGNRGGGGGFGGGAPGGGGGGMRGGFNFQDMMTPTDFWGKYTLAK